MPNCYICNNFCSNFKNLINHYRKNHHLSEKSLYKCTETNCIRKFPRLNSFRKHFLKTHLYSIKQNKTFTSNTLKSSQNEDCINNMHDSISEPITCYVLQNTDNSNNFKNYLCTKVSEFISSLYNKDIYPRNLIQNIIEEIDFFFLKSIKFLLEQIDTDQSIQSVCDNLNIFCKIFENLKTEHLRFSLLRNSGNLIMPIEYAVGQRLQADVNGILIPKIITSQFIPLRNVLKKFFEISNVFEQCVKFVNEIYSENTVFSNIIQGELWKEKISKYQNNLVFPLILYYDDVELGNPLGSHSSVHKIGVIYASIPVLPPNFQSFLNNILVTCLFHTDDLKEFGSKVIFSKLIEELKFLELEGIIIELPERTEHLFFVLTLIIGDNLGLNKILGFTESFSSTFFCRFCKCPKNISAGLSTQNDDLLRTVNDYNDDLIINNVSLTGIKEPCVWNSLKTFHATNNLAVDLMHDLLEGVCNHELSLVIYQFIFVNKYFTLQNLNSNIEYFNSGCNSSNKPPLISIEDLKNERLRMTASEMLCFVRNLGLIFGYLIPDFNKHWKLILILKEIISCVTQRHVQHELHHFLKTLITEHHDMYMQLFKRKLKPKHHLLLHYPLIMQHVGPLINIWCMRFEAKHRELKRYANVVSSRVNITKTLALKQQLMLCERFLSNKGFEDNFQFGPTTQFINNSLDIFKCNVPNIYCIDISTINVTNWVRIFETKYKINDMIMVDNEDLPIFGKIKHIFFTNSENIWFICQQYKTIHFNYHLFAYEIQESYENHTCIMQNELFQKMIFSVTVLPDGKSYIPCI